MSYCTADEYEARYGAVSDAALLAACLEDASDAMDAEMERGGVDASKLPAARLRRVCRQVAHRLMPSETGTGGATIPGAPSGVTSTSTTMGPFSQQLTFSQPYGTPRLQRDELTALGIVPRMGFVWPVV